MNNILVNRSADNIRILSAAMVEKANSGHPGGAMGGADFINILYAEFLKFDPKDPHWFNRDRFFLDPGHMSPMLYATLAMCNHYSIDELKRFRQWGSATPGHPEADLARGVENTSGPLGQGHTMAVGAAIAQKFLEARFGKRVNHTIYAFISDGGIQEEISQGAGRIAGFLGLNNLVMFYDSNDIQLSTNTDAVTVEDTAKKYEAWGWAVCTIEGNNPDEIRKALKTAQAENEKPFLIIGKTIMGKGAVAPDGSSKERDYTTHGQPLTHAGASFEKTVINLGGSAADPFAIFDDVAAYWKQVLADKTEDAQLAKLDESEWAKENTELAEKLANWVSGAVPKIDYEKIEQKADQATRVASATILTHFAKNIDNMIVMSADLANSDKTDGFLKGGKKPFIKNDFSGGFLHAGVSELTMASIANGMALHGGVWAVAGTFFVFSDYMKPAARLAALMQLPVKYVWTHDAFRVGEDGPTHQPIEHEAQIRLLEQLKNHHGKNSMLVLRPADVLETSVAWKMAMENTDSPTALLLSRQNITNLPAASGNRYHEALQAERGAYIVQKPAGKADVILVANGSEVSTISEGLFRTQSVAYQKEVIPADMPVFGLTAGLPSTLQLLVGINGKVFGLDHFGFSAPANILDEKFGFTPENVYNQVVEMLS